MIVSGSVIVSVSAIAAPLTATALPTAAVPSTLLSAAITEVVPSRLLKTTLLSAIIPVTKHKCFIGPAQVTVMDIEFELRMDRDCYVNTLPRDYP